MRTVLFLTLALASTATFAHDRCEHRRTEDLSLDLRGVKAVVFEIGAQELDLRAAPGSTAVVHGLACASSDAGLDALELTQIREGDRLVVRAGSRDKVKIGWGDHHASLKLTATLPDSMPVRLHVGSGEAKVSGVRSLSADVGSGEAKISHVAGTLYADVGSGDLDADDVGALKLLSLGSGDASFNRVRGRSEIGSVRSGSLGISGTGGDVRIDTIGSGDVVLRDVRGDVALASVGSGALHADGVGGDLTVQSVGSGDVRHSDVTGRVSVPTDD